MVASNEWFLFIRDKMLLSKTIEKMEGEISHWKMKCEELNKSRQDVMTQVRLGSQSLSLQRDSHLSFNILPVGGAPPSSRMSVQSVSLLNNHNMIRSWPIGLS